MVSVAVLTSRGGSSLLSLSVVNKNYLFAIFRLEKARECMCVCLCILNRVHVFVYVRESCICARQSCFLVQ